MKSLFYLLTAISFSIAFQNCYNEATSAETKATAKAINLNESDNRFKEYWYQNKAEISSYHLEQARYGEIHQGDAVMIFVTEHFSKSKLVKLDDPSAHPKDAVPVLKLNATRNFNTGIYPYSMMTSVFTPVDLKKNPNTLKISTSSQEWCGHTYMQAELKKNNYEVTLNSYFESEGNQNYKVEKVTPEDEIWTRLRIDPKSLPVGKVKFLPGTIYSRLRHTDYKPQEANATLEQSSKNAAHLVYSIEYLGLDRKLSITFEKEFPFGIESWTETNISGFGSTAKTLTTKAVRNKSILLDYWVKHNNEDLVLRKELGLD